MPPQSRPPPPSHPGAPRPIPEVHPGAPRPISDTHPGAPQPVPTAQAKSIELPQGTKIGFKQRILSYIIIICISVNVSFNSVFSPVGPPPVTEPPAVRPQVPGPVQPQATALSTQSQLPPPMQPTLPAPLLPQQAAAAAPLSAGITASPSGPPQGLASPKPPPRSRSSHALPPDAAKSETAPAAQVGVIIKLLAFQQLNKEHYLLSSWMFLCFHIMRSL